MIEVVVREYLSRKMDIPIFLEHQEQEPKEFIILEKVGASSRWGLKESRIAIQSYGASLYKAAIVADEVANSLEELVEYRDIVSVQIEAGPYHFSDLETKRYRYQLVVEIKHY